MCIVPLVPVPGSGTAGSCGNSLFTFEASPDFAKQLHHFPLLPAVCEGSTLPTSSAELVTV